MHLCHHTKWYLRVVTNWATGAPRGRSRPRAGRVLAPRQLAVVPTLLTKIYGKTRSPYSQIRGSATLIEIMIRNRDVAVTLGVARDKTKRITNFGVEWCCTAAHFGRNSESDANIVICRNVSPLVV